MNYFTPELIVAYGVEDSATWHEAEVRWEAAVSQYNAYIKSIKDAFPDGLRRLEENYFLHDAVIQGMGAQDGKFVVMLRLDPPPQPLVTLRYELVEAPAIHHEALPPEYRSTSSHAEWQYDEIEETPGEPRTWRQSILLSNGWEVSLHFRDVQVEELHALLPAPRNGSARPSPPCRNPPDEDAMSQLIHSGALPMSDTRTNPTHVHARREFLKQLSAASLAALGASEPRVLAAEKGEAVVLPRASADACILLWMAGGMAAPDTFDPKRYVPFKVGVPASKILSTFPAIPTAVDRIKISQGLENIARVMDRGALIRSHMQPDLGNILHSRHQYHWHTGYVPPQTVAAPHLGAWIARVLGPRDPAIPAFIDVGQRLEGVGEKEELKAFHTAGFLGSEFGPFLLPYPEEAVQAVRPPRRHDPRPLQ